MKKIICAVLTGVIAATCAAPAFACTPTIRIDMSWKKDLDRTIANIKPSDITIPNFTIPDSYFKNIKVK
mgnify:FL=1